MRIIREGGLWYVVDDDGKLLSKLGHFTLEDARDEKATIVVVAKPVQNMNRVSAPVIKSTKLVNSLKGRTKR